MTENLIESTDTAAPAVTPEALADTSATPDAPAAKVAVDDNLFKSLGLGKVDSDPNAVADGWYDATVRSASIVHIKSKNGVSAVVNYALTGDYSPAQYAQFQQMGINPDLDENGEVTAFVPTMSDKQKQYLKKLFTDLGIAEGDAETIPTKQLLTLVVGRNCRVQIRKRDGYRNVVDVQYVAPETPVALSPATVSTEAPTTVEASAEPDPF